MRRLQHWSGTDKTNRDNRNYKFDTDYLDGFFGRILLDGFLDGFWDG